MPIYNYIALNSEQRRERGNMRASHKNELAQILATRKLVLIKARAKLLPEAKLPIMQLANLCANLAQLIEAGVPVNFALQQLQKTATGALKMLLSQVNTQVEAGNTLAAAFAMQTKLDNLFISMIKIGEHSGKLVSVLWQLNAQLEASHERQAKLRASLSYPLFALLVVLAVAAFLLIYLVPELKPFLQQTGGQMPIYSRALIFVAGFLQSYLLYILFCMAGLLLLLALLRTASLKIKIKLDYWQLKIWYIGSIIWHMQLAAYSQNLALMYTAGVSLIECLEILEPTLKNHYLKKNAKQAKIDIMAGASLSGAFAANHIYTPLAQTMLQVGEQSGSLQLSLNKIENYYRREAEQRATLLQAMLNPALTLLLGGLLLWIMAATLMPIYQHLGGFN